MDRFLRDLRTRQAIPFVRAGDRLLDIGCYDLTLLERCAAIAGQAVGIDPLAEPRQAGNIRLLRGSIGAPGPGDHPALADGSFDCITMLAVLEHVPDAAAVADRCAQLLAPGGRVVITVPRPEADAVLAVLRRLRLIHGMSLEEHHGYDVARTAPIFEAAGLVLRVRRSFELGLNNLFVFEKPGAPATAPPRPTGLLGRLHGRVVHERRTRVLADRLGAALAPVAPSSVLDIGCGDGRVADLLRRRVPGLRIEGIDVVVRERTRIPVRAFDGRTIPYPDRSFDAVTIVDVLHHASDPAGLLAEAARVARRAVVIKDHLREGLLAGPTLTFMDYVGNAPHGIHREYRFWTRKEWHQVWRTIGLSVESWDQVPDLYPRWASWVFGRRLHFITRLAPAGRARGHDDSLRPEMVVESAPVAAFSPEHAR